MASNEDLDPPLTAGYIECVLQQHTCRLIHHPIQININAHSSRRKESVLLFYLLGNVHTHAVEHYPLHWIIKKLHPLWRRQAPFFQKMCQCNYLTWTKEKILSHTTSVGNKRKQTENKKTLFISNIVSIVPSSSKKQD